MIVNTNFSDEVKIYLMKAMLSKSVENKIFEAFFLNPLPNNVEPYKVVKSKTYGVHNVGVAGPKKSDKVLGGATSEAKFYAPKLIDKVLEFSNKDWNAFSSNQKSQITENHLQGMMDIIKHLLVYGEASYLAKEDTMVTMTIDDCLLNLCNNGATNTATAGYYTTGGRQKFTEDVANAQERSKDVTGREADTLYISSQLWRKMLLADDASSATNKDLAGTIKSMGINFLIPDTSLDNLGTKGTSFYVYPQNVVDVFASPSPEVEDEGTKRGISTTYMNNAVGGLYLNGENGAIQEITNAGE